MRAGGRPARRRTANRDPGPGRAARASSGRLPWDGAIASKQAVRDSEEHTSELQSQSNHVCRLLLETKSDSLACALRETLHMGDRAADMMRQALVVFEKSDPKLVKAGDKADNEDHQ